MPQISTNPSLGLTVAYKAAVLALMITEINFVTDRLNLPEVKPVTQEKLRLIYVSPPLFSQDGIGGTLETDRFVYAFGKSGKLTTLGRLDLLNTTRLSGNDLMDEYRKRSIPLSRIDTNSAWQAMLPYLRAGLLDLDRLNRECGVELSFLKWGNLNVPIYTARWTKAGDAVASIKILMPDKILLALLIEDPSFSLRSSLRYPEATNAPRATNSTLLRK